MNEIIEKSKTALERIELREIMDNSIFVDNAFLKQMSKLTLTESKIVRFLIMKVRNVDEELKEVEIDIKTFADLIGIRPQNLYAGSGGKNEKDICRSLMKKDIFLEDPNDPERWIVFGWLAYADHERGKLKLKLNEKMKDYLLFLKKQFTVYKFSEIAAFRSVYSIRIYELILLALSESKTKKPKDNEQKKAYLSLDLLKKYLGIEDKYQLISHLKARVLEPAMEDINERSEEYHVSYENDKAGRTVIGFIFTIETKIGYDERIRREKMTKQLTLDDYVPEARTVRVIPD